MIKNDLFLRALKGETVQRPPVWMMRQAGRYLPEFMAIKKKYDFFTRCRTPNLQVKLPFNLFADLEWTPQFYFATYLSFLKR